MKLRIWGSGVRIPPSVPIKPEVLDKGTQPRNGLGTRRGRKSSPLGPGERRPSLPDPEVQAGAPLQEAEVFDGRSRRASRLLCGVFPWQCGVLRGGFTLFARRS